MELHEKAQLDSDRESILEQLELHLETPMVCLGFVWLVLTIIDLVGRLSPFLSKVNIFIWFLFIVDYAIKFIIAPKKLVYVRRNIITLIALAIPALRVVRIARAFQSLRIIRLGGGVRFVRIISSFNRGMHALGRSLGRRGFGYVVGLTFIVTVLGAAGMYTFEHQGSDYMKDFGTALWWTAMIMTTMGSDYFPKSPEGRLLCLLLATYGFAVFGYVTATVASFFVEREAANDDSDVASAAMMKQLQSEIRELKTMISQQSLSRNRQLEP